MDIDDPRAIVLVDTVKPTFDLLIDTRCSVCVLIRIMIPSIESSEVRGDMALSVEIGNMESEREGGG